MKKKHHLAKILSAFSLLVFLSGCTTLSYVDDDFDTVKSSNIQTQEMFSLQTYEKTSGEQTVKAGISETVLDQALVLYLEIKNNSDVMYKFDTKDVSASSPIGEVTFIAPSSYIEAYQNYEASNYAGLASAGTSLNSFANIQNQYRQTISNGQTGLENRRSISPELLAVEETIQGIQKHSITSYKFLEPHSTEYFYLFLRKPEEYPVVIQYKDLVYKFGNKKNAKN